MTRCTPFTHPTLASLLLAALLGACGGGGDDGPGGGAGGTLTLSATTPAAQATSINLATATSKGNAARAADVFSSLPYCEVFWENASGSNGRKYAVQVYFRQGDKQAMHVSVLDAGSGWSVYDSNSGAAIGGLTVSTSARTVVFNNKALAGAGTEAATLSGTASFGANAAVPACGA